ncbi:hypothetical protein, partial [Klebsiella pneumoniae]|uniref:hypothetical protein n=1 Tax=Klebsiella pneumoniae TaxID=573 RepID=UPI001E2A09AD
AGEPSSDDDAATHLSEEKVDDDSIPDETVDPNELNEIYDQFEVEDNVGDYEFAKILDHEWKDGILHFQIRYLDQNQEEIVCEHPFEVIKKDIPLEIAKFIRNYVVDSSRKGYLTTWATKKKVPPGEKFGFKIPRSTREA